MGAFSGMQIGPIRKIALIAALSAELEFASAGNAEVAISLALENSVGKGLDSVLFSSSPASDSQPAGLWSGTTPLTPTAGGTTAAMITDLKALVASVAAAGVNSESIVFVVATGQGMAMRATLGPHFAHNIIVGDNLDPGTVAAVAVDGLVVAGQGTPRIDVAKQATLHVAAPAAPISTSRHLAASAHCRSAGGRSLSERHIRAALRQQAYMGHCAGRRGRR